MSLRIYSEMLPYAEVVRPRTLALLARNRLELVLAVRPWDLSEIVDVAKTLRDSAIPLSVWPMLSDEDGRWANTHNAATFTQFVHDLCIRLDQDGVPPRDVLFDLEPPFARVRKLATLGASHAPRVRPSALPAESLRETKRELAQAVAAIHARGITTSSAVWPLVALDPVGKRPWQSLIGTPVDGIGTGHVSVMIYTTIFEGWSRGLVSRRDATALLAAGARRTLRRWGDAAGVSLGCVGTGAFADEPTYRGPEELAEDVAVARAAGASRLALFDLAGVMAREPAEAWLEAFVGHGHGHEHGHGERLRVAGARMAARAATWGIEVIRGRE